MILHQAMTQYIKELRERYEHTRKLADIALQHGYTDDAARYVEICASINEAIIEVEEVL